MLHGIDDLFNHSIDAGSETKPTTHKQERKLSFFFFFFLSFYSIPLSGPVRTAPSSRGRFGRSFRLSMSTAAAAAAAAGPAGNDEWLRRSEIFQIKNLGCSLLLYWLTSSPWFYTICKKSTHPHNYRRLSITSILNRHQHNNKTINWSVPLFFCFICCETNFQVSLV